MQIDLVDMPVIHKVFGKGTIAKYNDSYVEIDFLAESLENKKFVFPDAFGTYLTLLDKKAASIVKKMVQKRNKETKEKELEMERLKAIQEEKRQNILKQERLLKEQRSYRINPSSQSVFWCEMEELDHIFVDWNVFTGTIKSGIKKGQPKRLVQMNRNSACLITSRDSYTEEENRRILGIFMVSEHYNPKLSFDGYIPAHSEYKIKLTEQESEKMLFWNYYYNKRQPKKITWNTGRHRYFDNLLSAQILRDIVNLKDDVEEKKHAEQFLDYFCKVNRIKLEDIPESNGSLLRK